MSSGAGPQLEERRLDIGPYAVTVATGFGPRILEFGSGGTPPLFARLPDEVVLEHPDSGTYRFRGGHRLWAAPEVPAISYASDERPCRVEMEQGVGRITSPMDRSGLVKTIEMRAAGEGLVVDHTLSAPRGDGLELAAWAITQLRLGGVALLPVDPRPTDGPQPSASVITWPYTDLTDTRLGWERSGVTVRAEPGRPFKIGVGPDPGRIGYFIEGHLFTKEIAPASERNQPDRGAVAEVYVSSSFIELESLGPRMDLGEDRTASNREVWSIRACRDLTQAWEMLLEEPRG